MDIVIPAYRKYCFCLIVTVWHLTDVVNKTLLKEQGYRIGIGGQYVAEKVKNKKRVRRYGRMALVVVLV